MPRLQGVAQREVDAQGVQVAYARKAEFKVRGKPIWVKLKTTVAQLGQHIVKVGFDKMRQQETVV